MGNRIEHRYNLDSMACPKCGENVSAEMSVTEYPEGIMEGGVECSPNVNGADANVGIAIVVR